ncbi:hypothetical protein H8E77_12920 [bacterium]|nr:hypothetical protein [bacterium]
MQSSNYNDNVFVNCPFDKNYNPLFNAMVFAIFDCGFIARCALEEEDASQIRIEKIYSIIANCRYGIHDISRTELDANTHLPRFNMPLELGIFLGAKKFGTRDHKKKQCLILDKEQYRYQKFISDIAGQDIQVHNGNPEDIIKVVRNWLRTASKRTKILGGDIIRERYQAFIEDLPKMAMDFRLDASDLIFSDYTLIITEWLKINDIIIG